MRGHLSQRADGKILALFVDGPALSPDEKVHPNSTNIALMVVGEWVSALSTGFSSAVLEGDAPGPEPHWLAFQ